MNDLLDKIVKVVNNPTEIINSKKVSTKLGKAALTLAVVGAVLNPLSQAYAHTDTAHHVHYEYVQMTHESKYVKDHIQNVADAIGISVDQHNSYLNYEHPLHSKINDFLIYAHDNYSEDDFNEIKDLAEKAQKHFDNGFYEQVNESVKALMPLTNDTPIFFVETTPENESYNYDGESYQNLQATIKLFNKMIEEPSLNLNFTPVDMPNESVTYSRTAIANDKDNGYVTAYFDKNGTQGFSSNIGFAAWYATDMNRDSKAVQFLKHGKNAISFFESAYNLTDLDKDILLAMDKSHEIGHLNKFEEINGFDDGAKSEFCAEIFSAWNDIQAGASEGYLEFRKDVNIEIVGIVPPETPQHNGYALFKTFYDNFSYDEIKNMSLEDITQEAKDFINAIPEDILTFEKYALQVAQNEVSENGIYPKAQKFFLENGEKGKANLLNKAKEMTNTNIYDVYMAQYEAVKGENSNWFTSFVGNNFPSTLLEHEPSSLPIDYKSEAEYAKQLDTYLSNRYEQIDNFEYNPNIVKNAFDNMEGFVSISENTKITKDGTFIKKINDVQTINYNLNLEVITKINDYSVDLSLKDNQYNDIEVRFNQDGGTKISMNGGEFKDLKSRDFDDLDSYGVIGEIAKTIQDEENENLLKTQFNNDTSKIKSFFDNSSEPESSYQNDVQKNNVKQKL